MAVQPTPVSRAPEAKDIIAATMPLASCISAWAWPRSSGAWLSASSVVPEITIRFQPVPSRKELAKNSMKEMPDSATTALAARHSAPTVATRRLPKRSTSVPENSAGANMPITCHWITCAADAAEKPQTSIASGVAFITRIIRPWPMAVITTAARRPGRASRARMAAMPPAAGLGATPSRSCAITTQPSAASTAIAR